MEKEDEGKEEDESQVESGQDLHRTFLAVGKDIDRLEGERRGGEDKEG